MHTHRQFTIPFIVEHMCSPLTHQITPMELYITTVAHSAFLHRRFDGKKKNDQLLKKYTTSNRSTL